MSARAAVVTSSANCSSNGKKKTVTLSMVERHAEWNDGHALLSVSGLVASVEVDSAHMNGDDGDESEGPRWPFDTLRDRSVPRGDLEQIRAASAECTARAIAASTSYPFAQPPTLAHPGAGTAPELVGRIKRMGALERLSKKDEAQNGWSFSHNWIDAHWDPSVPLTE